MDKKIIAIVLLSLVLIGIIGFFGFNKVIEDSYNSGAQDTFVLIQQQIMKSLEDNGYVSINYQVNGETQTLTLVPYQNTNSQIT